MKMMQARTLLHRATTGSSLRINRAGGAGAATIKTQSAARAHIPAFVQVVRSFSGSRAHFHSHDDHAKVGGGAKPAAGAHDHDHDHDHDDDEEDEEDEEDMESVVDIGPLGKEFGGPQRGGKFKEPTRFGDWERKGRCTDF
ncbi:hypothetical protein Gpo141_00007729 [Globisporangium polare]